MEGWDSFILYWNNARASVRLAAGCFRSSGRAYSLSADILDELLFTPRDRYRSKFYHSGRQLFLKNMRTMAAC